MSFLMNQKYHTTSMIHKARDSNLLAKQVQAKLGAAGLDKLLHKIKLFHFFFFITIYYAPFISCKMYA